MEVSTHPLKSAQRLQVRSSVLPWANHCAYNPSAQETNNTHAVIDEKPRLLLRWSTPASCIARPRDRMVVVTCDVQSWMPRHCLTSSVVSGVPTPSKVRAWIHNVFTTSSGACSVRRGVPSVVQMLVLPHNRWRARSLPSRQPVLARREGHVVYAHMQVAVTCMVAPTAPQSSSWAGSWRPWKPLRLHML